jgi:two-component system OmpR family sensor kinase
LTLRVRLTLLYTSLLGGTLLLYGALVYALVSLALVSQTDNFLLQQAEIITKGLRVNSIGQFDILSLNNLDTLENNVFLQVWGTNRNLQYGRPRNWQKPLDPAGRMSGLSMFNTAYYQGVPLRVLSIPLITQRGPSGTLQVGVTLSLLDTTQKALASVLILLAVISMILAAMIASFAIDRALAPLSTMTHIAEGG